MNNAIKKLLCSARTREAHYTHISMGAFKSKYNLSRNDLEKFFSNYNPDKNTIC